EPFPPRPHPSYTAACRSGRPSFVVSVKAAIPAARTRGGRMKYLLTFARDQEQMYQGSEEEMKGAMDAWNAFDKEAVDAGALIACEPLEHPSTATTIRIQE